jgi:hypothetical protein
MFSSGTSHVFHVTVGHESPLLGVRFRSGTRAPMNWTGTTLDANRDAVWTCDGAAVLGRSWELTELTDDAGGATPRSGLHEARMEACVGVGFHLHLPGHLGSDLRLLEGCRHCIPLL